MYVTGYFPIDKVLFLLTCAYWYVAAEMCTFHVPFVVLLIWEILLPCFVQKYYIFHSALEVLYRMTFHSDGL